MSNFEIITVVLSSVALVFSFYNWYKSFPKYEVSLLYPHMKVDIFTCLLKITNYSASYGVIYKIVNSRNKELAFVDFPQYSANPNILIYPFITSEQLICFKSELKIDDVLKIYCSSKNRPFKYKVK